jgi:hypothetical protein
MVKIGDTVRIGNQKSAVRAIYGAGRHTRYILSDGREVLDLQLLIDSGAAEIVQETATRAIDLDHAKLKEAVDQIFGDDDEDDDE